MNSAWAVVLGAAIALVGSSVIPWVRDAIDRRGAERTAAETVVRDATIALLAANSKLGFANGFEERAALVEATSDRATAAASLLLAAPSADRDALALLLETSVPLTRGQTTRRRSPRLQMYALQVTLTAWVKGELPADQLLSHFDERLNDDLSQISD